MNSKAYPRYKPSGIEWLGDVPEHWDVKRARYMLRMNPSKQEIRRLDPDTELAFVSMDAVSNEGFIRLDTTRPISEVNAGYTFFAEGDVSFAKITPCFENGKGAIMRDLITKFGFGTTELTIMRPDHDLNKEYLYYLSVSSDFRKIGEAWMYGAGGQQRVPDEFVKEFRIGFPPIPEQQAIAAFLDRETGRIDALITKKKNLLSLLAEQRTALISRAVTKGLNPSVKLKPSGVEWLGDVPENWESLPIRRIVKSVKTGGTPAGAEESAFEDDGFNWYSPSDFSESICLGKSNRALSKEGKIDIRIFPPCTVMLVGIGATIGKVGLASDSCSCNQQVNAIVCGNLLDPEFATYYLKIMRNFIVKCGKYTTLPIINQDETKNLIFTVPPLLEQQAIASYLDRETAKIDTLSVKIQTAIERLKEYRTALISAAVTGKIDVREAV